MAQINKPTDYFNTKLYTGNGGTNNITGVGFQPDWVWLKYRGGAANHRLVDVVRGTQKRLMSNATNAESTETGLVTSFDSDGFTLNSSDVAFNGSSSTYVSWNWLADNTSGSSNTDGDITSTVSANTTSGFSIVSYTGNGSTSGTVGHGLGVAPKMILIKNRDNANAWAVYHKSIGATNYLELNTTSASTDLDIFNDTEPTSSVFSFGNYEDVGGGTGGNTKKIIAYCFAEKKGFSKFGSYTGNGSTDGTFVYTGFKPAFVIVKVTSSANSWTIQDNKRNINNPVSNYLLADSSQAEGTAGLDFDFVSNGFKVRTTSGASNDSGASYIYMAFAESPLVGTNNIPVTAR